MASFKNADKYYDTKLSKKLDRDIANEQADRARISKRRILKGRGVQDLIEQEAPVTKTASEKQGVSGPVVSALGGAVALLAAASFVGGFKYARRNDPQTVKFKAYKKGI